MNSADVPLVFQEVVNASVALSPIFRTLVKMPLFKTSDGNFFASSSKTFQCNGKLNGETKKYVYNVDIILEFMQMAL